MEDYRTDVTADQKRILVVEDERPLAETLRYGLEREGFACNVVGDGLSALKRFRDWQPDLVLLDLMLPGLSGIDVCKEIRRTSETPIIIVTARGTETERVLGLELGADDYVTKPYSPRELVARIRTVLRRSARRTDVEVTEGTLAAGPVVMDVERHTVTVNGCPVTLPPKEFMLLEYLMRRAGKLCTRDHLIATVWGPEYFGDTRTLDVHVKRLRAKIEEDRRTPRHLITVHGLGYKFES